MSPASPKRAGVPTRVGLVLVLALGACSAEPQPPASPRPSPALTCQPPPAVTLTDASGRASVLPIRLRCDAAIAALGDALATAPAPVVALEFAYGRYCPWWMRCPPFFGSLDQGYVLVSFDGAPQQVANVGTDASGQTILLNIELAPPQPTFDTNAGPAP